MEKKWYESKTIWANVLLVVAGVLVDISTSLQTGGAFTVSAVVNIVLRAVTKSGIKWS